MNCRAQGEVTIREALRELELWGVGAVFTLTDYEDSQGKTIRLIKDWKDIVNQVGDHRCLLQSVKDSPYYKGFEDKVSIWEKKMADLDEFLQNLNLIQRKWVYLEPIFGRGALPKEQARFNRVDEDFRLVMCNAAHFLQYLLHYAGYSVLHGENIRNICNYMAKKFRDKFRRYRCMTVRKSEQKG